ncbi:glycosyltransferase family 4 protein [Pseudovibrio exalbescens]|uniref:glycosyltransferase family 4 protein n=1 Tax=Pseudovibrio exalbescens TaxID=197461 RepID=UPI002366851D|nr:glycosyltransferase family 4 protein [Pseudovibrio exalbescens]MDD7909901.1 glycosyltransferase family 4 protein [Pseudovibrio exalbescens]
MSKNRRLSFVIPGNLERPTGGYRYDRRIISELRQLGWTVDVVSLSDEFPLCGGIARLDAQAQFRAFPDGELVVCDGLAFGVLPEVAKEQKDRLKLVALVHHPLFKEDGLSEDVSAAFFQREREALQYVSRIITTSPATLVQLREEFDLPAALMRSILPGTERLLDVAPTGAEQHGTDVVRILSVGSIIPRKGQDVLVCALAQLKELKWHLDLVGDTRCDLAYAAQLKQIIEREGLEKRVTLHGAVSETALAQIYAHADVFALASYYEGYGMAFAEALMTGLPIIASGRGAVRDTVPEKAALFCKEADVESFGQALSLMINDPSTRKVTAKYSAEAGRNLPTWPTQGALFSNTLEALL